MQDHFIEYLKQLTTETPILDQALSEFIIAKEATAENFREGVKRFINLANISPEERNHIYGNIFSGLYIHNDLAQLWNNQCMPHEKIVSQSLNTLKPNEWNIIDKDEYIALEYSGLIPAEALNILLKGPTVIDCGMFCQLGILFGIRFILGDDAFNTHFSNQSLLITRFIYEGYSDDKEHLGNPLFNFFTHETILNAVSIEHVFNIGRYPLKHPGGTCGGHNCLVIDNDYFIFNPLSSQKQFNRSEIVTQLIEAYNAPPDSDDHNTITIFESNPSFFQSIYFSIYKFTGSTFYWVKLLRQTPSFLESYTNDMLAIPACREKISAIFGQEKKDIKACFIKSFAKPMANREKYEEIYAIPCVKQLFQEKLELSDNKMLFNQYYSGILELFNDYRQSSATDIVSLEEYDAEQQSRLSTIPSYLNFDLNAFLRSVKKIETLSVTQTDIPSLKKIKQITFFEHSEKIEPKDALDQKASLNQESLT